MHLEETEVDGKRATVVVTDAWDEGAARVPKELVVQNNIRVALSEAGILVWRHHVDNRFGRTGLGLGVSDLVCIVPPHGRFLAIEVKRPGRKGRTSDDQKRWLALVERFGGVAGVATSVDEAMALVARARRTTP